MNDTIFAPATPSGGAIGVIRISGPEAGNALKRVFKPVSGTGEPVPRKMTFGRLTDGNATLDEIMACYFVAPASYTGEDTAELYLHGGQAVMRRALELLGTLGLRPAEPGEFTKRAFLNGRLPLSRAEAVMDMINAVTERGAKCAVEQLEGSVGDAVGAIEDALTLALAGVDAALDYPDELEEDTFSGLGKTLEGLTGELDRLIESGAKGRYIREGASVAILGEPNAGKSSLFNALLGRERAIVTPAPGTTRDTLQESLSLDGVPVRLIDTAGLREAADEAERIGVERANKAARDADITILAFDAARPLEREGAALLERGRAMRAIVALCKSDLPAVLNPGMDEFLGMQVVTLSSLTGDGLEALRRAVATRLVPDGTEASAMITNTRHLDALSRACNALKSIDLADGADCAAVLMHSALSALGEITGRDVSAAVIDSIFKTFCVGK